MKVEMECLCCCENDMDGFLTDPSPAELTILVGSTWNFLAYAKCKSCRCSFLLYLYPDGRIEIESHEEICENSKKVKAGSSQSNKND